MWKCVYTTANIVLFIKKKNSYVEEEVDAYES